MKLKTVALTTALTSTLALPLYAQGVGGVGVGTDAGAGVDAGVGGVGANAGVGAGATTDGANVGVDSNASASPEVSTGDTAAGVNVGAEVASADGQSIGTIADTRTSATGTAQAVIDVNPALGLGVGQVAVDAAGLQTDSEAGVSIGMAAQDFRESIQAQLEARAGAEATTGANDG
ncbi:hypothetical protein PVV74_13815 [Roseovarius sp. SK2]|uniref:hypothetical protein n=1 Tax=Roseovarius TaxID=74030 RepID=UPI00237A8313|nr:hypothetical protein [Roseovarius sp. SK2]MDD9726542.1 hypothetical protein [Roseovarius sp. SK2]